MTRLNLKSSTLNAAEQDRIDVNSDSKLREWAKKLDVSPEQIKEAVDAVGDRAGDVEMHLKGTRASSNAAKEELGEKL